MPGIRVQHPMARNVRYTIVEPHIPYGRPFDCPPPAAGGCGSTHLFKTHHLNIDGEGAVIVSTGVFDRIKRRLVLDGFVVTNEVAAPPTIVIGPGAPTWGDIPIVRSPSSTEPI